MELQNQVALVTGAGCGIGRAVAVGLAQAGADVGVNDINATSAEETAGEVRRVNRRAVPLPGDVSVPEVVERMVVDTVAAFGKLDIAIANAYYSKREPFWEADMAGFRRTIDVTMWGAFHLLRSAARQMISQRGGGSIVLVGSPHADLAIPRAMAYNMAKAAVDHMARTAAIELAEHRIRVNIVRPGWVDTPGERAHATEEQIQLAAGKLPWGRLCRPDEISRAVVFLCDRRSDYITGSTLLIDGGITLPWWASRGSGVPE